MDNIGNFYKRSDKQSDKIIIEITAFHRDFDNLTMQDIRQINDKIKELPADQLFPTLFPTWQ